MIALAVDGATGEDDPPPQETNAAAAAPAKGFNHRDLDDTNRMNILPLSGRATITAEIADNRREEIFLAVLYVLCGCCSGSNARQQDEYRRIRRAKRRIRPARYLLLA